LTLASLELSFTDSIWLSFIEESLFEAMFSIKILDTPLAVYGLFFLDQIIEFFVTDSSRDIFR